MKGSRCADQSQMSPRAPLAPGRARLRRSRHPMRPPKSASTGLAIARRSGSEGLSRSWRVSDPHEEAHRPITGSGSTAEPSGGCASARRVFHGVCRGRAALRCGRHPLRRGRKACWLGHYGTNRARPSPAVAGGRGRRAGPAFSHVDSDANICSRAPLCVYSRRARPRSALDRPLQRAPHDRAAGGCELLRVDAQVVARASVDGRA